MIRTEILQDGRTHTWSDQYMKIKREDGVIYDDAIDVIEHTYIETDIPIEEDEETKRLRELKAEIDEVKDKADENENCILEIADIIGG